MEIPEQEWFSAWFGSKYYDILYRHRDGKEADGFIKRINERLRLQPASKVLDLACGAGRHSKTLCELGFHVTGLDLSSEFIAQAIELNLPNASFRVHDMRLPFGKSEFGAIFNLFTSFGYFSDLGDNTIVIKNVVEALKPGGYFVLDYLNIGQVKGCLNPFETKEIDGVQFTIRKEIHQGIIQKTIQVKDGHITKKFKECVQAFTPIDLSNMLDTNGLSLIEKWGDYAGNPFKMESPRCILLSQKR